MSVAIMTQVWQLDLPDSEKIVLLALADCANDEGLAWPSMATLAKKCSKGERTCQGVIKQLVEKGVLQREEIIGKGCKYIVTPRSLRTPAKAAPPQRTAKTPAAAAPKPSRTITSKDKSFSEREALPDWLPTEAWEGWIEMRKRLRKAPSPRAIQLAIAELERLRAAGNDPGAVLDQSTLKSWAGLFEVKAPANQNNPTGGVDSLLAQSNRYTQRSTACPPPPTPETEDERRYS